MTHRSIWLVTQLFALLVAAGPVPAAEPVEPRDEWFRDLDIESVVGQSELILVTRIEEVREIPMPVGGKGERTLLQIRFQPARVLKGVFARDGLTLTSYDLGLYQARAGIERLRVGDRRLLFLGRSQSGYQNRNVMPDIDRSLPPLSDGQDPLIASVNTLLAVRAASDRVRRVTLLSEALATVEGAAAVPLLKALARRAVLAAQRDTTLAAITPHLTDRSPAVRMAAGEALRSVLAADYLAQSELRSRAAHALAAALGGDRPNAAARIALIRAAGELGPSGRGIVPAPAPDAPLAIQRAQLQALGRLGGQSLPFAAMLAGLPLDHPNAGSCEIELARTDPETAANLIPLRAQQKLAAGLSIEDEIQAVTPLPVELAVTTLVRLAALPLSSAERQAFAAVAEDVSGTSGAHRALGPLVAPLAAMLDPVESLTRQAAVAALVNINTADAARALLPRLREETDLAQKLLIAEFLGQHGLQDGYPYAIEHMSEPLLLERAVAALAAIGEPRAIQESRQMLETSNDDAWNRSAIRALGAMGDGAMAPRLLGIVADWKNPLVPAALVALGDLGETRALPAVRAGLDSRNEEIVVAAARSAGSLLRGGSVDSPNIRDALAALVADTAATERMRAAALESLVRIADVRLDAALASAVTDASLEGSSLLNRIETLLRERKVRLTS